MGFCWLVGSDTRAMGRFVDFRCFDSNGAPERERESNPQGHGGYLSMGIGVDMGHP